MHRSSESVAALAGALAKAQTELINPEKSLSATIRGDRRGERDRAFRYAPLASGLDIVRRTLGKHELAIVQTTAVDQPTGLVNLTTMLAHSSGEWISSNWPVCQVSDINMPHRMGSALTYARRYALFALVGIAGEDDLDAPDLKFGSEVPHDAATRSEVAPVHATEPKVHFNGRSGVLPGFDRKFGSNGRRPVLNPEKSQAAREQMLGQIAGLVSTADATQWARDALPIKNQLTTADAGLVEQAFATQIAVVSKADQPGVPPAAGSIGPVTAEPAGVTESQDAAVPEHNLNDKTHRLLRAPPRRRDKAHLKFVATQPCVVCGRQPSDPHHLRFAQPPALGRKVSDEFTVPLCRSHHRELHRTRSESKWWTGFGLDPMAVATGLWEATHRHEQQHLGAVSSGIAASSVERKRDANSKASKPPATK